MPWLLNEDAALHDKLNGITVSDENAPTGGRSVAARFRLPETPMATLTYPNIIITRTGIEVDHSREHRGPIYLPYTPEGSENPINVIDPLTGDTVSWDTTQDFDPTLSPFHVQDYPVPVNILYQIEVNARLNQQITDLIAILSGLAYLPPRFGYLEIPQDGTVRSLFLLAGPYLDNNAERDDQGKRQFRAVYSISVASELNLYGVTPAAQEATAIDLQVELTVPITG